MPTAPVISRPSPSVSSRNGKRGAIVSATLMAAIAALGIATTMLLADPDRVEVHVENPTAFGVSVEVHDDRGGGRLRLGVVSSGIDKTFTGVIDQGAKWVFEFSYAGVSGGTIEVTSEAMKDGPVVVPGFVEETLRDAGLTPPEH